MRIILLALFALSISITAQAQSTTVGELLSKGAKKLTKAEVEKIYAPGVTISGISPAGNRKFELTYKGGKLSGRSTDLYGLEGRELEGKWTITDEGRFCAEIRNARTGADSTPRPPCGYRFMLNGVLYSSRSVEPDASAQQLSIIK